MTGDGRVTMDQLRVGMYVNLDLKWFEHPFAFSQFKIKNEEQIRTLRSLGLKSVRYTPALSEVPPLPADSPAVAVQAARPVQEPEVSAALQAKRAMMGRIMAQREAAARIEAAFTDTARAIRDIEKNIFSRPEETVRQAQDLIARIGDSILCAPELAIHVMGDKLGGEELYFHSLNVTMLATMMARDLRLPQEVVGPLGMGALFHDIGHKNLPDKVMLKVDPLTQAERNLFEMHCQYGIDLARRLDLPAAAQGIVRDHHEQYDGSGYPRQLKGDAIGLLSRIVSIANYYDELCNPVNVAAALTPHEALSLMFAKSRSRFDPKLLQVFIRCLGVYPPGTIVQLSNGVIGMIATVNTNKPMKPMVVIYDANIPKEEAILVDMDRETELSIVKAIRPSQVPQNIYAYLSPRKRVSYYFDAGTTGSGGAR